VHLVDIILDNRVSCKFIDDRESENVIFCRPLEECLHNITLITTKDDEFVHNYIEESNGEYIVTSVTLPNGEVHDDIKFKLVECELGTDLPHSIINLETLGTFPDNQNVLLTETKLPSYEVKVSEDTSAVYQHAKELENALHKKNQKLNEEKISLLKEREELQRKQLILEDNSRIQKTLEDYKADLLQETFLVGIQQKELLEKTVLELESSLQEQFDSQQINVSKYLDTVSSSNLNELKEHQNKRLDLVKADIDRLLTEKVNNLSSQGLVYANSLAIAVTASGAIGSYVTKIPIYNASGVCIGNIPVYL